MELSEIFAHLWRVMLALNTERHKDCCPLVGTGWLAPPQALKDNSGFVVVNSAHLRRGGC